MQALLPAMFEKLSAFFVNKFKEFELDRDRQQQDLLQKLESMTSKRQFVNVNCSSRNNADLDVINLEVPRTVQDSERIKGMFLPVSKFLREMWKCFDYNATMNTCMCIVFLQRWQPKWKDAGLPYTSFTTSFSVLLQSRKLKHTAANGGSNFHSGQFGRAPPFYTVEDRSFM